MSTPKLTLLDRIVFLFRPVAQLRRVSPRCTVFLHADGRISVKHVLPGRAQYARITPSEAQALAAALQALAADAARPAPSRAAAEGA